MKSLLCMIACITFAIGSQLAVAGPVSVQSESTTASTAMPIWGITHTTGQSSLQSYFVAPYVAQYRADDSYDEDEGGSGTRVRGSYRFAKFIVLGVIGVGVWFFRWCFLDD